MTDTDTPSPTTKAATDAHQFERSSDIVSMIGLAAMAVIKGLAIFHVDLPGFRVALTAFVLFWVIRTAFAFCRHLIVLSVFHRHISEMERYAFILKVNMEAMRKVQSNESDDATEAKEPAKPTDEHTVIDIMSRLRPTDDEPKA